MKVIDCKLDRVDWIIHVADIHIRNWKRHTEYREVFESLYELVRKSPPNTIVTLGGDIVHAKTDMSPELIDMVNDLFVNLAKLAPTFVICGNHDTNLNNNNRLDALSPIFKALNQENLFYLKDTDVYEVGDICLSVMSLLQPESAYIKASSIKKKYKQKIAMFHGTVENSSTDTGIKLLQGLKMSTFDGYDVALLGDIHKRQVLKTKPLVFFPGSLIQQNFGEDFVGHGAAILDVNTLGYTFEDFPNEYGYYTLVLDNGVVPEDLPITSKTNLRLKVKNTTPAQLKRSLATIRKIYKNSNPALSYVDVKDNSTVSDLSFSSGDIRRVEYQNDLIKEFLLDKHIDDETLDQIFTINKQLNANLPQSELVRNVVWNPKKFQFSNMFSYGENNVVDFTGMQGLCGLFAVNTAGKSAILDALCFCCFDHSFRASKAEHILNIKSDWFSCDFNFELNGLDYFISKKATRYKKGPLAGKLRVDIDFSYINEQGESISLNGEQRRDTDRNIQSYIGTYDDFILTAISLQNNNSNFIDKTQGERKELLANFLDLCIFDQLFDLANKENKNSSILLEEYQKQDFETKLGDAEASKESNTLIYKDLEAKQKVIKNTLAEQEKKVLTLTRLLKTNKAQGLDLKQLENEKSQIESMAINQGLKLNDLQKSIDQNKTDIQLIREKLATYDEVTLSTKYTEFCNAVSKQTTINLEIERLKVTIKTKLEKLANLEKHEYDPNCKYCIDNIFVKDAIKTKQELELEKQVIPNKLEEKKLVDEFVEEHKSIEASFEKVAKLKSLLKDYQAKDKLNKSQIETLESTIDNFKHKLNLIESNIQIYHENEQDIEHNNKTQLLITAADDEIIEVKKQEALLAKKLQTLHGTIVLANNTIEECVKNINHMQELSDKQIAYDIYCQAINKDGIPYILISKAIPYIEQYINNILSQIVDFTLQFETDGKYINTYMTDDKGKRPLELSSGMERFIASLAIRIALIKITNLPKPNFIALDEGLGVLDSTNLNSMHMLFNHMKGLFKHTLVISHLDVVRDMVDHILTIDRTSDFSHIKYP